ncbi:MAG TPA: hypothetical protein EYQ53_03730 [Candidatus Poseidoniales archaeon]|jgi:thiol-disulfide isomerase/thioredoxin|nr:MAG: hypothetical protein CXT69_00995 [Euryarchaeota archaeon]HIG03476.1 hypothetical protein [Candidatus Poseidoniales archaeon]HIK78950.1 hypothetical protein [Candidatus Poseidoniales archaeon]
MRVVIALAFAALALSASLSPAVSATRIDVGSLNSGEVTISGGGAVLYELHTATWCESCAEFDDLIEPLRTEHDERMAFIALHPDDDDDKIGNSASQHRLNRLHAIEGRATGTPTSFMDGVVSREGEVSGSQISLALFDAESSQRSRTSLTLSTTSDNGELIFELSAKLSPSGSHSFNGTQLTIMIADDDPEVGDSLLAEGAGPFHATLFALFEVDINENGSIGLIEEFPAGTWTMINSQIINERVIITVRSHSISQPLGDLSILATHEVNDDFLNSTISPLTLGAVSFFQADEMGENILSGYWIATGLIGIGVLIIAIPSERKKISGGKEEE